MTGVWRRRWHPTPVLLPGKSHGWRTLVGCSPWGREESDTTEQLHFDFLLSCTREGNGNPLRCSCLENPRDGGAWWAAVYEVTQSRTRLKRLSSSSSRKVLGILSLKFFPLCILVLWSVVYCKLFCFFYDPNWPVYKCYLLKALISSFTYQLKNIKIP